MRILTLPLAAILLASPVAAQRSSRPQPAQPRVTAADRAAHERMIVLDTHLDVAERFDDGRWDLGQRHAYAEDGSQVDLPRMREGGMDGGFFVIYTAQGPLTEEGYRDARDRALVRAAAIRRVIGENRGAMDLALTADDAERSARAGRRFGFISMENGWPLGRRPDPAHDLLPARPAHGGAGAQPGQPARRFGDGSESLGWPVPLWAAAGSAK